MGDFFQENSEGQTGSTDHHHGMQQQNLRFVEQNARFFESSAFSGQETDHHNAGNVLVGLPIPTITTTPVNTNHQNYNLWVGLPDPTHDPGRVPDQVHGFEFFNRDHPHPPVTVVSPVTGKRLSLGLSSQQQRQQQNSDHILNNSEGIINNNISLPTGPNGVVFGSKYLKATQELLDEVVSMGNDMRRVKRNKKKEELITDKSTENCTGKKPVGDLTTAQRQELQIKKAKLVNMIEEVEQRYRQYQNQMQFIVSSFEQAAGHNAARTYTFLALQTISKQFRCLKDAITSEIKSISKNLGEDECMGAKGEGLRLRFADHHHHYHSQQLRHLGMMHQHHQHHHNAWRPQRGLPERAVSILRAWLFEHFLHPYPRDSDKHMLARQTGLTRSQVSNWFINARVRLWKPMVEEMYMEEIRQQDGNAENTNNEIPNKNLAAECSNSTNVLQGNNNYYNNSDSKQDNNNYYNNSDSKRETSNIIFNTHNASPTEQCSSSILSSNYLTNEIGTQNSSSSMVSFDLDNKQRQQQQQQQQQAVLSNYVAGFGQYHPLGDSSGRFYGHGISLSLGLPRSLSDNQRSYGLSDENMRGNIGFGSNQIEFSGFSTAAGDFQSIDDVHVKKRYGSAAMLPDFLA